MTFAVSAMMGRRLPVPFCSSARGCARAAVKPSMTGIWQSMSTASKAALGQALESFRAVVGEGHVRGHLLQEPLCHALVHGIVLDEEIR